MIREIRVFLDSLLGHCSGNYDEEGVLIFEDVISDLMMHQQFKINYSKDVRMSHFEIWKKDILSNGREYIFNNSGKPTLYASNGMPSEIY